MEECGTACSILGILFSVYSLLIYHPILFSNSEIFVFFFCRLWSRNAHKC